MYDLGMDGCCTANSQRWCGWLVLKSPLGLPGVGGRWRVLRRSRRMLRRGGGFHCNDLAGRGDGHTELLARGLLRLLGMHESTPWMG